MGDDGHGLVQIENVVAKEDRSAYAYRAGQPIVFDARSGTHSHTYCIIYVSRPGYLSGFIEPLVLFQCPYREVDIRSCGGAGLVCCHVGGPQADSLRRGEQKRQAKGDPLVDLQRGQLMTPAEPAGLCRGKQRGRAQSTRGTRGAKVESSGAEGPAGRTPQATDVQSLSCCSRKHRFSQRRDRGSSFGVRPLSVSLLFIITDVASCFAPQTLAHPRPHPHPPFLKAGPISSPLALRAGGGGDG